ncbi:hypothetical protein PACTADRAFT_47803 [Pachysolen tannophilus NRRL Y-2460]|uniref:Pantothenate kinase n=1 Tax=Pachysolen tannophilus NRRL Y-2460 TaxID=669874 RepID=A0A1E4U1W2_PACTA|nr:hypothetical protein PACTADRAFT_47803 [Pachysolen tannophilus NRRL Y-2460]
MSALPLVDRNDNAISPSSRSSSGGSQESIYSNFHCPNSISLNVTNAHIVSNYDGIAQESIPETKDIALPNNLTSINHVAIDIGGSLAKLIYFAKNDNKIGGKMNFVRVETDKIDDFIKLIKLVFKNLYNYNPDQRDKDEINKDICIMATGGGAFKFYDKLFKELKCNIVKEDEMQCLIIGLDFFITEIPNEIFTLNNEDPSVYINEDVAFTKEDSIYPYLLVNIGSGVSMIKVTGPNNFVRVGGSSLGGGTLWGLLSVLTTARDFDEMLEMALKGDNENVDLLVGDIYGKGYNKIGLKSNHIASSFGKAFKKIQDENIDENEDENGNDIDDKDAERLRRIKKFKESDISRSLLYAISNNIGQISYLQAQRYNLKKIYFAGSYIRGHPQTIHTLSYAINFWSNGKQKAYFLKHESYLGSMGAFLKKPKNDVFEEPT